MKPRRFTQEQLSRVLGEHDSHGLEVREPDNPCDACGCINQVARNDYSRGLFRDTEQGRRADRLYCEEQIYDRSPDALLELLESEGLA